MIGKLAKEYAGIEQEVQVLRSAAGYYIGTEDDEGPISRESEEYWPSSAEAEQALSANTWTQQYYV